MQILPVAQHVRVTEQWDRRRAYRMTISGIKSLVDNQPSPGGNPCSRRPNRSRSTIPHDSRAPRTNTSKSSMTVASLGWIEKVCHLHGFYLEWNAGAGFYWLKWKRVNAVASQES